LIKRINIDIIGFPEGEKEKGTGNLFEKIIAENFPNLGKETDIHIQEVQRTQNQQKQIHTKTYNN